MRILVDKYAHTWAPKPSPMEWYIWTLSKRRRHPRPYARERERVYWMIGDAIVCSPENAEHLVASTPAYNAVVTFK